MAKILNVEIINGRNDMKVHGFGVCQLDQLNWQYLWHIECSQKYS